ncbi:MAG: CBS domain-containing protein [Kofleriaceae bacterium]
MRAASRGGMLMPPVSRFMTREPYRVHSTCSLEEVRALMMAHEIRHIPVVDGEKLAGVISDNDVRIVQAVPGVDLTRIECARLLTEPLCVRSEASLDEVADLMAKRKVDCVLVVDDRGIQGVFTSTDALFALGEILQRVTA